MAYGSPAIKKNEVLNAVMVFGQVFRAGKGADKVKKAAFGRKNREPVLFYFFYANMLTSFCSIVTKSLAPRLRSNFRLISAGRVNWPLLFKRTMLCSTGFASSVNSVRISFTLSIYPSAFRSKPPVLNVPTQHYYAVRRTICRHL